MKLKATDQLHVSNVQADPIRPGEQFEIAESEGRQLVARGLATAVKPGSKGGVKKAQAPANKAAATPENKALGALKGSK